MEDEAVTHGADFYISVHFAQGFDGFELAVFPAAFDELEDQDFLPVSPGADGGAQGCGGLAFAGACIDEDQSILRMHVIHLSFL